MPLDTNASNFAQRAGNEAKALRTLINGNALDLSSLTTTAKNNLVAAVNEVKTIADAAAGGGVSINDTATNTTQTWSSQKITDMLPTWDNIALKPAFIAAGTTAQAARDAIGAGTSNLAIGTGPGDAKAGDYHPSAANITDATVIGRNVLTAADGPAIRTLIGAGTSSLVIGTTGTTAAAGNRQATEAAIGMVELATTTETTTGTDTTRAVTPAGVKAVSDTKAPLVHDHDSRYYTEAEVDSALALKSDTGHDHLAADVTDLQTYVDGRVQLVVDAAPAALDTLNELAAALGDDPDFAGTITTALGKRVAVDQVQAFTGPEQAQARANIGAASAAAVGDTEVDLVAIFEAALT